MKLFWIEVCTPSYLLDLVEKVNKGSPFVIVVHTRSPNEPYNTFLRIRK